MGPFIKSKEKTSNMMIHVIIALIPIILFTVYKNGYIPYSHGSITFIQMFYPILFILIGSLTSFIIETIYCLIKKQNIFNCYSFFPGLFLSLLLTINTPIYILIIGSAIATIFGKLVFGGFGKNIINPALIGYVAIIFIFGSTLGSYHNAYEIDTISKSTPLTNASMVTGIGNYDELVKPYGGLDNFFFGFIPGGIGEISALLCIVAFIYLAATKTIKWRIPVCYVTTVFIITLIIGRLLGEGIYYPLFQILSGGLLFGAIFMATDPVTSCVTPIGQILQGIFLGILTVILRFVLIEGVAISILVVSLFVFLFDKIGSRSRFNITTSIIPFILVALIIMATGITVAGLNRHSGSDDPNFSVISKDKKNNETIYVVTQKGYGGNIKGEIIFENNKIKMINILNHNETKRQYQLVIDQDYINELINNQNDLNNLDTVSSATVTSNALKKMINNVLIENS